MHDSSRESGGTTPGPAAAPAPGTVTAPAPDPDPTPAPAPALGAAPTAGGLVSKVQCQICDELFDTKDDIVRHLEKTHHLERELLQKVMEHLGKFVVPLASVWVCPLCLSRACGCVSSACHGHLGAFVVPLASFWVRPFCLSRASGCVRSASCELLGASVLPLESIWVRSFCLL